MSSVVSIKKCSSYNFDELYRVIKNSCEEAKMPDVKGKTVLLKVNILSDSKPENCITTNPEFVRALSRVLKDKGVSKILVGDSPGLHSQNFNGKVCGINEICKEEGLTWVNFAESPNSIVLKDSNKTYSVASVLKEVDYVFSVPKFKTHTLMYATGAVKNMFGTIVGLNKSKCHMLYPSREKFARFICNLYEAVKPDFSIMDGIIGMEGAGPANGNPYPSNLVIASKDGFAVDFCQAVLMGYDPMDLPILKEAKRRHLIDTIEYSDLKVNDIALKNFKTIEITKKSKLIKNLLLPFCRDTLHKGKKAEIPPTFLFEKCIHCKRCINICPAKALSCIDNNSPIEIDTNKCIRCYCCHEMCPANAIEVKNE